MAVSCLHDLDFEDALPVLTPYDRMRIPNLPVVPYFPPSDPALGGEVEKRIGRTPAVLLRNYGSIAVGTTLAEAAALAEEIEEAARRFFLLGIVGRPSQPGRLRNLGADSAKCHVEFAGVADDDTGAIDRAGMLTGRGLRSTVLIGEPSNENLKAWTCDCDVVVFGTASRSIVPADAYQRARHAVRLPKHLDPRVIHKVLQHVRSTTEGNIGPSIDAAMDELDQSFTIAIPALPENGRTTDMGHHLMHEQLLSESAMRLHALNPMTNSNLFSHLARQTTRTIRLAPHPKVRAGSVAVREHLRNHQADGIQIVIVDCISEEDLEETCNARAELPLIAGSSAPAMCLPSAWQKKGWWEPANQAVALPPSERRGRGILIASGRCSEATRWQNAWLESDGCLALTLETLELAGVERMWSSEVNAAISTLREGRTCLIKTSTDTHRVHRHLERQNQSEIEVGERIASSIAAVVRAIDNTAKQRI
jgi:3-dehydrotetronate 4-kinase